MYVRTFGHTYAISPHPRKLLKCACGYAIASVRQKFFRPTEIEPFVSADLCGIARIENLHESLSNIPVRGPVVGLRRSAHRCSVAHPGQIMQCSLRFSGLPRRQLHIYRINATVAVLASAQSDDVGNASLRRWDDAAIDGVRIVHRLSSNPKTSLKIGFVSRICEPFPAQEACQVHDITRFP